MSPVCQTWRDTSASSASSPSCGVRVGRVPRLLVAAAEVADHAPATVVVHARRRAFGKHDAEDVEPALRDRRTAGCRRRRRRATRTRSPARRRWSPASAAIASRMASQRARSFGRSASSAAVAASTRSCKAGVRAVGTGVSCPCDSILDRSRSRTCRRRSNRWTGWRPRSGLAAGQLCGQARRLHRASPAAATRRASSTTCAPTRSRRAPTRSSPAAGGRATTCA